MMYGQSLLSEGKIYELMKRYELSFEEAQAY